MPDEPDRRPFTLPTVAALEGRLAEIEDEKREIKAHLVTARRLAKKRDSEPPLPLFPDPPAGAADGPAIDGAATSEPPGDESPESGPVAGPAARRGKVGKEV